MDGFRFFWIAPAAVLLIAVSAIAEEPAVEDLLKKVPILSPDNKSLTSFQCVVMMPVGGSSEPRYVKMHLGWSAPDHFGCLTIDDHTNVPFMFGAANKVMLYDATSASLTILESCMVTVEIQATEEKFQIGYGFSNKQNKRYLIDLPSFVLTTRDDHVLEKLADHRWKVTATSKSGRTRLVSVYDMSKTYPLQSVEIRGGDADLMAFGITDIRINEELDARLCEFPPASSFPPDLELKQIKEGDKGFLTGLQLMKRYAAIMLSRQGLDDESVRKNIVLKHIDWDAAERIDEIAGPSLRVLFGLPDK